MLAVSEEAKALYVVYRGSTLDRQLFLEFVQVRLELRVRATQRKFRVQKRERDSLNPEKKVHFWGMKILSAQDALCIVISYHL